MGAPAIVAHPLLPGLLVLLRLAIAAGIALDPGRATRPTLATTPKTTVLTIGDGDTLWVDDRGKRLTIRLACIDAPEMAQAP